MRKMIAIVMVSAAAFVAPGIASAACNTGSPDAVTSKPPAEAKAAGDTQAAAGAKGIAEDGQHTPLETDPNAPGVTKAEGGTTTNTAQAEAEIAAGAKTDGGTTASITGGDMASAGGQDPACTN